MGNFGIKIETAGEKAARYSVISPYDYRGNTYVFGQKDTIKAYFWHGTGRLVINDLTKKHIGQTGAKGKDPPDEFRKIFTKNIQGGRRGPTGGPCCYFPPTGCL
jgi:hypothetical protein